MHRSISFTLAFGLIVFGLAPSTSADDARSDAIVVRAIERMKGYDYQSNAKVKAAVERHVERTKGTPEYLNLLKRFRPDGFNEKIEAVLFGQDNSSAVEAAKIMGEMQDGPKRLREILKGKEIARASRVAEVLGFLGSGRSSGILASIVCDDSVGFDVRRSAVAGMAKSRGGQSALVKTAQSKKLVGDTRLIAGALLARHGDNEIKLRAAEFLPQPASKDRKPLPPIDKLAEMKGSASDGQKLFRGTATCANCHQVGEHGREVGPNLSEIGSKLSREAMLTAILDPSAGISHNYENYKVLTAGGQVITGLKMSETDDQVVIRTVDAIDRVIPTGEIELLRKSEKSIMPENLHHSFDQKGLIDIVEYMTTLKKKG